MAATTTTGAADMTTGDDPDPTDRTEDTIEDRNEDTAANTFIFITGFRDLLLRVFMIDLGTVRRPQIYGL
jgi:hypothetical protein